MTRGKGDLEIRAPCYHVTRSLLKPMFVKRENPAGKFGDCLPSQCFLLQLLEDSLKRAGDVLVFCLEILPACLHTVRWVCLL